MLVPQKSKGPQRWCHLGKSLVFSKRSIHLGVHSYLGNRYVVLHCQVPVFQCEAFATAVWKDDRILQKVCRRGGGTQIIVILDKTCLTPELWVESFLLKVFTCYTYWVKLSVNFALRPRQTCIQTDMQMDSLPFMSLGVGSLHWNPGAIVADFEPQAGSGKPPKKGQGFR